jgi:hypothetical protein
MTIGEIVEAVLVSFFGAFFFIIGIFGSMFFVNQYFNKRKKKN